jgi:hypothetical protein
MAIYLFHLLPQGDARRASLRYRGRFRKSARARHPCRPGEALYGGICGSGHTARESSSAALTPQCARGVIAQGGGGDVKFF